MNMDDKESNAMTQEHSERQARRAAKRVGLQAHKSRWRAGSIDNFGEFMIVEPRCNYVVAGARFDYTTDDVVEFCANCDDNR